MSTWGKTARDKVGAGNGFSALHRTEFSCSLAPVTDSILWVLATRTPAAHTQSCLTQLPHSLWTRGGPEFHSFLLAHFSVPRQIWASTESTEAASAPQLLMQGECSKNFALSGLLLCLNCVWGWWPAWYLFFPWSARLFLAPLTPSGLPHPSSQASSNPGYSPCLPRWHVTC